MTDVDKKPKTFRDWIRKGEQKAKEKKWFWPVMIVYLLLIFSLVFVKYSCTWGNDGTYETDHVFLFEKLWYQCMPLPEYDENYRGGIIASCLEHNPGADPWHCVMPSPSPNIEKYDLILPGGENEAATN